MARQKGVSLVTLLLILGLAIVLLSPTGQSFISGLFGGHVTPTPPPSGYVYSGNLNVNIPIYDIYDDSAVTPTGIVVKLWHADQKTLVG